MTDQQIVHSIASHNSRSIEDTVGFIYAKYSRDLVRFAQGKGCDQQEAEDIFQETIMAFLENVWREKYEYREGVPVKAYLFAIAHWKVLKYMRDRERQIRRETGYADASPLVVESFEENDWILDNLKNAFEVLGGSCKQLLYAYYYEKMPLNEIATLLDLGNADSAKTKKYRCIQRLKKILLEWDKS